MFAAHYHKAHHPQSILNGNEPFQLNAHVSQAHPRASTSGWLHLSFTSKPLHPPRLLFLPLHRLPSSKVCSLTLCLRPDAILCPIRAETCRRKKKTQPAKKFRNIPQRHPAPRQNTPCSRDSALSFPSRFLCHTSKQAGYTCVVYYIGILFSSVVW